MSLHLLGAERGRAVLVRVRNPLDLAKAQGGSAGRAAAALLPQAVSGMVLDKMAEQFRANLKANGVDAEVVVVADDGSPAASGRRDVVAGVVVGVALSVAGWAGWRFGISRVVNKFMRRTS